MADEPESPRPADEESPPPPAPPPPQPWFSNFCPNDLGMKAGFWSGNEGDAVTFRPVLGWLVVSNGAQIPAVGPLEPITLNDNSYPIACRFAPGFIGVFDKNLTPEEALAQSERWRNKPGPPTPGGQSQLPN